MVKKLFLIILLHTILTPTLWAHKSSSMHENDMLEVLGFKAEGKPMKNGNARVREWANLITSNIDRHREFGKVLKARFPGLKYQDGDHRFLFHWAYNDEPWTNDLEQKAKDVYNLPNQNYQAQYSNYYRFRDAFKRVIRLEYQKRKNEIETKTREIFGFENGGIGARYCNCFASLAYNVHLLGDYMLDNTVLYGLTNIKHLLDKICEDILNFAKYGNTDSNIKTAHKIINAIEQINNTITDENKQQKAEEAMSLLKREVPALIKDLSNGAIKSKLEKMGYKFVPWYQDIQILNELQSFKKGA